MTPFVAVAIDTTAGACNVAEMIRESRVPAKQRERVFSSHGNIFLGRWQQNYQIAPILSNRLSACVASATSMKHRHGASARDKGRGFAFLWANGPFCGKKGLMKLSSEDFDRIVRRAIAGIPSEIRQHLDNVVIAVRKRPTRRILDQHGLPPGEDP
jgi:hypothetical protein